MNATAELTTEQIDTCLTSLKGSLAIWEDAAQARDRNPKWPHPFGKEYVWSKIMRLRDAIAAIEALRL